MKALFTLFAATFFGIIVIGIFPPPEPAFSDAGLDEEAIVMHCVDKRYSKAEHITTLPEGYHFCAAGCAQRFIRSEVTREDFYEDLAELAAKGINLTEVIIVDHRPCKAYEDDSFAAHERNLREAAKMIHRDPRSQRLKVRLYIHDMDAKPPEKSLQLVREG